MFLQTATSPTCVRYRLRLNGIGEYKPKSRGISRKTDRREMHFYIKLTSSECKWNVFTITIHSVFGAGLCQCPWRWIAERWNLLIHHWLWSDVIDRERNWVNGCLVQMCSMQQSRKGPNENHEIKPRSTIILNNNGNDCMLRNCIFSLVCRNSTFHLF